MEESKIQSTSNSTSTSTPTSLKQALIRKLTHKKQHSKSPSRSESSLSSSQSSTSLDLRDAPQSFSGGSLKSPTTKSRGLSVSQSCEDTSEASQLPQSTSDVRLPDLPETPESQSSNNNNNNNNSNNNDLSPGLSWQKSSNNHTPLKKKPTISSPFSKKRSDSNLVISENSASESSTPSTRTRTATVDYSSSSDPSFITENFFSHTHNNTNHRGPSASFTSPRTEQKYVLKETTTSTNQKISDDIPDAKLINNMNDSQSNIISVEHIPVPIILEEVSPSRSISEVFLVTQKSKLFHGFLKDIKRYPHFVQFLKDCERFELLELYWKLVQLSDTILNTGDKNPHAPTIPDLINEIDSKFIGCCSGDYSFNGDEDEGDDGYGQRGKIIWEPNIKMIFRKAIERKDYMPMIGDIFLYISHDLFELYKDFAEWLYEQS
eukprot:TRINITY_DN976_c9_g1_i1.p1 TRINITY_DN976_c9_g1~~TRINITY_DN976_c9_g1_i1.p1  ORF type:complete len:434 (+),score=108.24 TRINITY_DN976_c9_g1_i1:163-1464(+)